MVDIDDPFKPSEVTVLRPRPGAGRRGAQDPPTQRLQYPPAPQVDPVPEAARDRLAIGLNPLVQAASPLLMLAGQFRGTLSMPDVAGLKRHTLDEIRRFEERARASGIPNEVVLAARYVLCAGLDEAVLSTPWGAQSEWAQQTLLVGLHREAWGGEKFFEMLDRISSDTGRHIDLMELQYLCLAFGFAGKYQVLDRGHGRLADVQQALYRRIREHRGTPQTELSLRWRGLEDRRNPLIRYVPWWVVGAASLGILAVTFVFFYTSLGTTAAPVHAALANVGTEAFAAPAPAAPVGGPTLKRLLAAEEERGAVSVVEEGGKTTVTVEARDLFASGSAGVNEAHVPTLQRIAEAIEQVPGRVLIEGHTDDQPLRSARYANNGELSRARAVTVFDIMSRVVTNPARLEHTGVGSEKPRSPGSDPDSRARNRRVDIIHLHGA